MTSDPRLRLPRPLRGRFQALGLLGEGGMGQVLLAEDRELERRVAVKVGVADATLADRFLREAEALARVRHPHLVQVYDFGVDAGAPYLVMEHLDGETLEGPLGNQDPLDLLLPVAEALEALHRAGLVHRDLKPSNVLVTTAGRPVLIDLGLGKDPRQPGLTRTGEVVGTPRYLAPETLGSDAKGPPLDWYAWGVTLYRVATGEPPFSTREVIEWISGGDPPPLDVTPLPPHLVPLVRACLQEDPRARPAGRRALEDLVDEEARRAWAMDLSGRAPREGHAERTHVRTAEEGSGPSGAGSGPRAAAGGADRARGGAASSGPRAAASKPGPVSGPGAASGPHRPAGDSSSGLGPPLSRSGTSWRFGLASAAAGLLAWGLLGRPPSPEAPPPPPPPTPSPPPAIAPGLEPLPPSPEGFPVFRNSKDQSVLVLLPPGTLRPRRSPDSRPAPPGPAREVGAVLLARHEVTVEQYARFLDETGRAFPQRWSDQLDHPDHPVTLVHAGDAAAYCGWAGGRLPTADEWELAAAGPEGRSHPWGEAAPDPTRARYGRGGLAEVATGTLLYLAPRGSHPAGAAPGGIEDLVGNVAEWTSTRPDGSTEDGVVMGGSWYLQAPMMKSWFARTWPLADRASTVGFRLARSVQGD